MDIMEPTLQKALKHRGDGKDGAWTNLEALIKFVVDEDDDLQKEKVVIPQTTEERDMPSPTL